MTRNERAYYLAQEWVSWLDTRRFYAPPEKKNILARLQGGGNGNGREPDGPVVPEMVAFNLAVTALPMKLFMPFVVVYCHHKPDPVKVMAHGQRVSTSKFYERAHRAAHQALSIADTLLELNRQTRAELEGLA